MKTARRTTLSAAAFVLICFFLPWVQVSCLGAKDSVSGFDLAREGDGSLWLILALMLVVLLAGLVRGIWERMPVLFAMTGVTGGGLSAALMYRERVSIIKSPRLVATSWTGWFWLAWMASLVVAVAAFWFYVRRVRSP